MKIIWPFMTLLTLVAVPAYADDAKVCAAQSANADAVIRACTNWLKKGHLGPTDQAKAYHYRALAYEDADDYDSAYADFEKAIKLQPSDAGIYYDRALAYEDDFDYESAIADLDKAIKLQPDNAQFHYKRGLALGESSAAASAYADFDAVIRLEPNNAGAYFYRGLASWSNGNLDRAIADFSKTIELGSDEFIATAYHNRGSVYAEKGELIKAIADLGRVIEMKPDKTVYRARGRAFLFAGDFAKAESDFRSALALDPKDALGALWLDIAERRGTGQSHLDASVKQLDMKTWPAPIVRFYLGELTPKGLAAEAEANDDACEADYFSGELALANGDKAAAKQLFEDAKSTCTPELEVTGAANGELRALELE